MLCPHCESSKVPVQNTRKVGRVVNRSRRCENCFRLFKTEEVVREKGTVGFSESVKEEVMQKLLDLEKKVDWVDGTKTRLELSRQLIQTRKLIRETHVTNN